jgi:hypothetical protein
VEHYACAHSCGNLYSTTLLKAPVVIEYAVKNCELGTVLASSIKMEMAPPPPCAVIMNKYTAVNSQGCVNTANSSPSIVKSVHPLAQPFIIEI